MARTQKAVKYLNEAIKEAGNPSNAEICRRAKKEGLTLAESTARDIISGKSLSPEVGNLEALAAALKKPALDLISLYLKTQPSEAVTFEDSNLAELWRLYERACMAGQKSEADGYIRFISNALKGLT